MDSKELYEALDTVWTALPDDAARQEFVELVRELVRIPGGLTVERWLRSVER